MRGVTVVTLIMLIAVSYGLYRLKYTVEAQRNHVTAIENQIETDKRAIKVLRAEWAYLTRPQRLEDLSKDFMTLEPLRAGQISNLEDIPERPAEILPEEDAADRTEVSEVAP